MYIGAVASDQWGWPFFMPDVGKSFNSKLIMLYDPRVAGKLFYIFFLFEFLVV